MNVNFIDRVIKKWNQPNFRADQMGDVKEIVVSSGEVRETIKRQKNIIEK